MIHLEDINTKNWRTPLKVKKEQEAYVANSTVMLARAYAYKVERSRAFLICNEQTPVGMGLYYDCDELEAYDLSQIFIDERFQGKGYGKAATELVLNCLREDGRYKKVVLCYIEGNEAARSLYEGFGFVEIDRDEEEIIMELLL